MKADLEVSRLDMKTRNALLMFVALSSLIVVGCNGANEPQEEKDAYTITWKNYDNNVLEVDEEVPVGTMPSYDGVTPVKPFDGKFAYVFNGWNPDVKEVTKDETYTAKFEKSDSAIVIDFDLDGGTSPSYTGPKTVETLTVNDLFFDVAKPNWNFRGWTYNGSHFIDEQGNILTALPSNRQMTFKAKYEQNTKISVKAEPTEGGTVSGGGTYLPTMTVNLVATPNTGYSFDGWYYDGNKESDKAAYSFSAGNNDKIFIGKFVFTVYTITYVLDGGTNSSENPSSYTMNDEIILKDPTRSGYKFEGWFNSNNQKVTKIEKGSTGNITLTARWGEGENVLKVQSENTMMGTVTIVSGDGTTGGSVVIKATPKENYVFKYWYDDSEILTIYSDYEFTMPAKDYTITAKFELYQIAWGMKPVFSNNNKTVTYGLYPTERISDTGIINTLKNLTKTTYGGVETVYYDGKFFAYKKAVVVSGTNYKFNDGTTIQTGQYYWYRMTPVRWNVLYSNSLNQHIILSEQALDGCQYYSGTNTRTKNGYTIYPNNYQYSGLREFLNGDFYSLLTCKGDSYSLTHNVMNDAASTGDSGNAYACDNTQDKVDALSYKQYTTTAYGFNANGSMGDDLRKTTLTDYALAAGTKINGITWTRSPSSYKSNGRYVNVISSGGSINGSNYTNELYYSVRPSMLLSYSLS